MNHATLPFESISIQRVTDSLDSQHNLMSLMDVTGFFLCQSGWADVSINDKTFHLKEGDIYVYAPSTFVSLLQRSADLEGIAVKCEMGFVLPLLEHLMGGRDILAMRESPCFSLSKNQQDSIESMLGMIRERQQWLAKEVGDEGTQLILQHLLLSLAESLVHELLFDYAHNTTLKPLPQDKKDRIFQMFLVSLFKNYKREREVAFYAAEQCLSSRYFSSIVKEKSGHSALQWIIHMVISSARQMLKSSDLSVKEIAMDFGFPSQSFFGKYFKQYVGVSPKEYRRQSRNG